MDTVTKRQRSKNMAAIKSADTKPEMIVRKLLFREGFRYRLHYRRLPGIPDIVLPRYKTVILVHGCFWHQHRGCKYSTRPSSNIDYWNPKLKGNVERDRKNIRELKKRGWRIAVIWQCQVEKDIDKVREKMLAALLKRAGPRE